MTFPTVGVPDEDEKAKIRAQFATILAEPDIDTSSVRETEEQPAPIKRGRGRPPGSKNRPKPDDFAPKYTNPADVPTLTTPPLSTRDQKEVAKRLAGILEGVTGVASVAKPYFQMTPEEAEAIATPLSTYLIRQEATSGVAKQILEEYDMAAFAIALAAYAVRVYLDMKAERDEIKKEKAAKNVTPAAVADEKRETLRTVGAAIPESSLQSQEGVERPLNRIGVSASEVGWNPSGL